MNKVEIAAQKPAWYAFVTPPGKEYVAAYLLEKRFGAFTYVPTETRWRRRNRYAKTKQEFAFAVAPRYVLARFDGSVPWYWIFGMPAITGVVALDGQPRALPAAAVFSLMARVPNGRRVLEPTVIQDGDREVVKVRRRALFLRGSTSLALAVTAVGSVLGQL